MGLFFFHLFFKFLIYFPTTLEISVISSFPTSLKITKHMQVKPQIFSALIFSLLDAVWLKPFFFEFGVKTFVFSAQWTTWTLVTQVV